MEPSESKSASAVPNGEDPQQQQQKPLSSEPSPLDHPLSSDLNHAVEEDAVGGELHNKLDLNGADEGDTKNVNEEVAREAYGVEKNEEKSSGRTRHSPLRPDAEDCVIYMKTGGCRFGSSCRFNHPIRRTSQTVEEKAGEPTERSSLIVCKNYQRYGVCKFGKACRYIHTRGNSSASNGYQASERSMNNPATETNVCRKLMSVEEKFPERPGEPECRNFLKTGDCKFKSDCKFHLPRLPTSYLSEKGLASKTRPGCLLALPRPNRP